MPNFAEILILMPNFAEISIPMPNFDTVEHAYSEHCYSEDPLIVNSFSYPVGMFCVQIGSLVVNMMPYAEALTISVFDCTWKYGHRLQFGYFEEVLKTLLVSR